MSESKMTPGPWHIVNENKICFVDANEAKAVAKCYESVNARAIACLPELVDAARNVLELDRDTFPNYVRGTLAELRRILARIDGED